MPAQRIPERGEMVQVHEPHESGRGQKTSIVLCTSRGHPGTGSFWFLRAPDSKLELFTKESINRILEGQEAIEAYREYKGKENGN